MNFVLWYFKTTPFHVGFLGCNNNLSVYLDTIIVVEFLHYDNWKRSTPNG